MSQTAARGPRGGPRPGAPARRSGRARIGRAADVVDPLAGPGACWPWSPAACCCWPSGVEPARPSTATSSSGGVELGAWQDTVMRMAPLLLIALGLIVVFRAGIWNLGIDGQFLLAAAVIAGVGPELCAARADGRAPGDCCSLIAAAVGAVWTIVPAFLRARYGDQRDHHDADDDLHRHRPGQHPHQGAVPGLPLQRARRPRRSRFQNLLPDIPTTRIHVGVLVAGAGGGPRLVPDGPHLLRAAAARSWARTPAPPRHVGIDVPRLIMTTLPDQRGVHRPGRRGRDPRHLGLRARRLEPGLRPAGGAAGLPGPLQRDRRHPVRGLPRPPDHRRRLRDPAGRAVQRVHAASWSG